MALDPVVIEFEAPKQVTGWRRFIPKLSPRGVKILIAATSAVMIASMISFTIFSVLSTDKEFSKSHGLDVNNQQALDEAAKQQASLGGGNVAKGVGGTTGKNAPVITLTAEPATVTLGGTSTLKWSVTNNPKSCEASDDWSGAKDPTGTQVTQKLDKVQTYLFTITCKTDTGTGFATVSVGAIAQGGTGDVVSRPTVTLAANPNAIYIGDSSSLVWSTTNNPTSCTATGDWSGTKGSSGTASTGALNTAKSYTYTLTCQNKGGSGYATVTVKADNPPPDIPIVTISSNPPGPVAPGSSITLSWSATNNPTSCTASGDWSGAKSSSGSQVISNISSVKTYNFSIDCANSAGSTYDQASVVVVLPPAPVVTLGVSPGAINAGGSASITWSATNNPTSCTASGDWSGAKSTSGSQSTGVLNTVKTYSYTLLCSNAGGSNSKTATVVVSSGSSSNPPVVSLSASPSVITAGGSTTLSWSATNSPTSCTASGSWSGSKGVSGSQAITISTAGTYSYSLTCTNAGGTGSAVTSVTVNDPPQTYCAGRTPCFGPNDLALHAAPGDCWAWNIDWVINITTFRPAHPGGIKSGSTSTIENASATCNHNLACILANSTLIPGCSGATTSIPGYKDASGSTTHNHTPATKNNSTGSQLSSFRVGYYDATKP